MSEDGVTFDAVGGSQSSSCRYTAFSFDYLTQYQYSFLYRGGEKKKRGSSQEARILLFNDAVLVSVHRLGKSVCKEFGELAAVEVVRADPTLCMFGLKFNVSGVREREKNRQTDRKKGRKRNCVYACMYMSTLRIYTYTHL